MARRGSLLRRHGAGLRLAPGGSASRKRRGSGRCRRAGGRGTRKRTRSRAQGQSLRHHGEHCQWHATPTRPDFGRMHYYYASAGVCQLQVRLLPAALHWPVRFELLNATAQGGARAVGSEFDYIGLCVELKMVGLATEKLRTHCVDKAEGAVDASVRARKGARVHARRHSMSMLRRVGSNIPLRASVHRRDSSRRRGFHRSRTCSPCRGHRHSPCPPTGSCRANTYTQASAGTGLHLRRDLASPHLRKRRDSHEMSSGS